VEVGIAGGVKVGEDGRIVVGPKFRVECENKSAEEVGLEGGIATDPTDVDVGVFTKRGA